MKSQKLYLLPGRFAICRLDPTEPTPSWVPHRPFSSITRSNAELSIVAPEESVPDDVRREDGWNALRIGLGGESMDLASIGVLASLVAPLAAAEVSVFAVSTYDTDFILIQSTQMNTAVRALVAAGHMLAEADE